MTKRVFYPFSVINDVVEFFDLLKTQHRLKSSFALKKYSIYFDAKLDFKSAYFKSAKTESINIDSTKRAFYPFSFINDVVEFFALLKTQHRLKSSFVLKKYSIYLDAKLDFKSAYFKPAKTESINVDSTKRVFYPFSFINDVVNFFACFYYNSTLLK